METERSSESDGSVTSRRGFLQTTAATGAAVGLAAGAAGTATAQETESDANQAESDANQAESPTTPGEENATGAAGEGGHGGEGEHGGGKLVLTDGLLAIGAAIVLGVVSPIVFAIHLAVNSDKLGGSGNSGDGELKRIDS